MDNDKKNKNASKKSFRAKYRMEIVAYGLILYPLLHWTLFFVYGLIRAFWLSLHKWNGSKIEPVFVGLANYSNLIKNQAFLKSITNTIIWTIAMCIGPLLIGLATALLINSLKKGKNFYTALLYWPALVSAVVSTNIQKTIFSNSPNGLANQLVAMFGINTQQWFDDPNIALYSLMIFPFLFGFSRCMLFFIAGLRQIPSTFTEAARCDGATTKTIYFKIMFPLLKPIFFLNLILNLIESFKVIAPMQLITRGGPNNKTMSVVLYIYNQAFEKNNIGTASAAAFILFAIILVVTVLQIKVQGDQISYE